jgi:hypothetical protein
MRTIHVAVLIIVALLTTPQQPASASLQGIVVRNDTGEPLPKASVELRGGTISSLVATTDAEGRFFFPAIPPGDYRLVASKTGYVDQQFGQRLRITVPVGALTSQASPTINLSSGQRLEGVRIEMIHAGVISGRVVVNGKPAGNVDVKALMSSYELGQRVFTTVLSARTDDLGDYRIFWLPPGSYYIAAEVLELQAAANSQTVLTGLDPSSNPFFSSSMPLRYVISRAIGAGGSDTTMFVPMYPPGVPDSRDSTPVVLGDGSEVSGINIQVNPVPALHVRGTVTGIPPTPGRRPFIPISLMSLNAETNVADAPLDANGNFDFSRVSPGQYLISASNLINGTLHSRVSVDVRDRDVNVVISLAAGVSITGNVSFDGPAVSPDTRMAELRISLLDDAITGGFRQANRNLTTALVTPRPDGSFRIPTTTNVTIPTGNYRVFVSPLLMPDAGWASPPAAIPGALMPTTPVPSRLETAYVKSIRLGDVDVLNGGLRLASQPGESLEIVIGTNPGSVEGRVVNSQQQSAAGSIVVLIPENGLQFRTNHKFTSADASGKYQMTRVPPGDYSAYVWTDVKPGAWQDPDFIRGSRNRAVSVHVDEGKRTTLDLVTP